MKRISLFAGILLLAGTYSCQVEPETPVIQDEQPSTVTMTVNAGKAGTRTAVLFDGANYSVKWTAGDELAIAEVIEENFAHGGTPSPYQIVTSDPLAADAATATFDVSLANRNTAEANPYGGSFKYVGVYPPSGLYDVRWTGDDRAEWEANWGNTTTPDHAILMVNMPTDQNPTADSFDPQADLLVSQMVTSATQPTSLSLNFARVGTIAKVTLKGLPAGKTVSYGEFTFSQEWAGAYVMDYDPVLQKTGVFQKSPGRIGFNPAGVTVDASGDAVIWLRTLSGTLSNWFKFEVTLSDGVNPDEVYEKRVDLAALSRSLSFPEGGVLTFGVSMEKHYNLVMQLESFVSGETSLTMNMRYDLDGKPYSSVSYGLIRFNAAVHPNPLETVSRATADPGDIINLVPNGEGRVSYTDTGLTPGTEYHYLPFIVVDGTEYHPDYHLSLETLTHYDYAVPALVDMGLPSGTKWASFNLGSNAPADEGYYFAWGEVRPTESFSDSYSSKYWYQPTWSSKAYAKKYSTIAAFGEGYLVDMKTVLDAEDDAATVCLGGEWRTPTSADFGELFENCDISVDANGDYVYTSKINSNTITFPACGYYSGSSKAPGAECLMMTASLYVDGKTSENSALCADVKWGQAEYTVTGGPTRGNYRYNVRPVQGGTRAGYEWTAHTSATVLGGGQATVSSEFLVPEDLGNYQDYTYNVLLGTDITSYFPSTTISRNGNHTFTGLTPGTRYYYYVTWECKKITNTSIHLYGASEVRTFVAE